jgi:DNA-binding XRE family transcriptional regulator
MGASLPARSLHARLARFSLAQRIVRIADRDQDRWSSRDMSNGAAERNTTADGKPVPMERMIFARKLRAARKAARLTQREMGRIAGLAQPFISDLENGKTTVSIDNAAQLAAAVGQPLYKLLTP